ncbi:nuclear transport factor 2 family protein [Geitlerinema sp. PCC 9228]|uniref:nuclear transport factor 2 family protein n=1 Tax=Geitlerinema sp. PCC 9228 TaxID=111611 RepID=UPI0008F99E0E|nr:nuclear transport factor 2 family protein [Geitlerinema sp. PCC 9228]
MTATEIRNCIQQAAQACQQKDATTFASLFASNAELIISNQRIVGKEQIAAITANYLANCENIQIDIKNIIVEENRAVVEWIWRDRKGDSGKENCAANAISLTFVDGKIARWREYTAPPLETEPSNE